MGVRSSLPLYLFFYNLCNALAIIEISNGNCNCIITHNQLQCGLIAERMPFVLKVSEDSRDRLNGLQI